MNDRYRVQVLDRQELAREIVAMPVAKHLLEILRCPESRRELIYFDSGTVEGEDEEFLFCPYSKLRYRIDGGIPVMLIDEAQLVDAEVCAALESRAKELGLTPNA